MSKFDRKSEFDELKSPEERREWLEALHDKSPLSVEWQAVFNALGGQRDEETVLKVLVDILGVEPVKKGATYFFDNWEVSFDQDGLLASMSASSGVPGMIQADVNRTDNS